MYDLLAIRLEDAASRVTPAMKLGALHTGEIILANKLHPHFLTELEVIKTGLTLTTGVKALTAANLGYDVIRGGDGITKVIVTNGNEATWIDPRDTKRMENSFLTATVDNPVYTVFQGNLMVWPTTITSVEVWFLRVPPKLRHAFTYIFTGASPSSTTQFIGDDGQNLSTSDNYYNNSVIFLGETDTYHVVTDYEGSTRTFTILPETAYAIGGADTFQFLTHDFDLTNLTAVYPLVGAAYHNIMVTLAEATCFGILGEDTRRDNAWEKATAEIKAINARFKPAAGIGAKENK
jgi:hypothetical protein